MLILCWFLSRHLLSMCQKLIRRCTLCPLGECDLLHFPTPFCLKFLWTIAYLCIDSFPMERVKDWLERLVAASVQWGAILKQGTPSVLHKIGGLPFDIIRGRVNADGKDEFIGRIAMSIVENPKSKAITNAGDVEPSKFLSDDFNLSNISWRIGEFLLEITNATALISDMWRT